MMNSVLNWLFGRDNFYDCEMQSKQVEDYRPGYPRYCALLASHESFQLYRHFARLRTRLLLLKQDKIVMLERRLDRIDADENAPLFLGSSRDDLNAQRLATLSELDEALKDYDQLIERSSRLLDSNSAEPRNVRSLQNWVNGNGCLSFEETEYLTICHDLRSLAPRRDGAVTRFEAWLENVVMSLIKRYQIKLSNNLSRDDHVLLPVSEMANTLARIMIVSLIIVLISLPIIICVFVNNSAGRVVVIVVSLILFQILLSTLVTQKTHELILAGATYTTVLVVFVSETNAGSR